MSIPPTTPSGPGGSGQPDPRDRWPDEVAVHPSEAEASDIGATTEFGTPDPSTSGTGSAGSERSGKDDSSTVDTAKGEASDVKDTAVDAGRNVAEQAKQEASSVVSEAQHQAKSLVDTVGEEVSSQATNQQQRVAASVQSLAKELDGMASGSEESGPLTELARQAASKGGELATWLEDRQPRDLLEEVKRFARRRPVTFLLICGAAGVVAGRLTRGAVAANTSVDSRDDRTPALGSVSHSNAGAASGTDLSQPVEPRRDFDQ